MLIDLHTHTKPLSWDSLLSADDLVAMAKRAGLDGVCLTEHDMFWDHEKAAGLCRRHNFLVIPVPRSTPKAATSSSSGWSATPGACIECATWRRW